MNVVSNASSTWLLPIPSRPHHHPDGRTLENLALESFDALLEALGAVFRLQDPRVQLAHDLEKRVILRQDEVLLTDE